MGLVKVEIFNYGQILPNGNYPVVNPVDISGCIDFEDGIEIDQLRDGLTGIFVEISFMQTFYKEAFVLIRNLFYSYGLRACGMVRILRRDNIDVTLWRERGVFKLDFSNINIQDNSLDIDIIDVTLRGIINSNRSTKYDIPVNEWGGNLWAYRLDYERLPLKFSRTMTVTSDSKTKWNNSDLTQPQNNVIVFPQINVNSDKGDLDIKNVFIVGYSEHVQVKPAYSVNETEYRSFFSNQTDQTITITVNYDFYAAMDVTLNGSSIATKRGLILRSYLNDATGAPYDIGTLTDTEKRFIGTKNVVVPPGYQVALMMYSELNTSLPDYRGLSYFSKISNFVKFNISFVSKASNKTENITAVPVEVMLNRLLSLMTKENPVYSASIEWNTDLDPADKRKVFVAAEEIRGFTGDPLVVNRYISQYHLSFDDFEKWMKTLGYVPVYTDENTLVYRYYETLFSGTSPVYLKPDTINNVEIDSDISHSFTNLKIGYNEPKYESENGRYNVNGTFEFSTGLTLPNENTFNLISPFRSDHIGLELLLFDRDKENTSTDSRSDNDIFVFQCKPGVDPIFYLDDSEVYTFTNTDNPELVLLDASLSPQRLINRWRKYLATSTDLCGFTSTTSNRRAKNTTDDLYQDVQITETPFFVPAIATMESIYVDEIYNPEAWSSIIQLNYRGKKISGYLKNSTRYFSRREKSDLELILSEFPV